MNAFLYENLPQNLPKMWKGTFLALKWIFISACFTCYCSCTPVQQFTKYENMDYDNSPVYYMRLPQAAGASPNSNFLYVDFAPQLNELNPTYHLPLPFVANGKPSLVYPVQSEKQKLKGKPRPSPVLQLNNRPYSFNGKPTDPYLLPQQSLNSVYDRSSNIY